MGRASEVRCEGGAHTSAASKIVHRTRHHRTPWTGVLYAITIVMVLVVAAKLY